MVGAVNNEGALAAPFIGLYGGERQAVKEREAVVVKLQ
jgi:hypothetical protein